MSRTEVTKRKRTEAAYRRRPTVAERRRRDSRRWYWSHHEQAMRIRRESGARVRADRREIELSRLHPLIATILRHEAGELPEEEAA